MYSETRVAERSRSGEHVEEDDGEIRSPDVGSIALYHPKPPTNGTFHGPWMARMAVCGSCIFLPNSAKFLALSPRP